MYTSDTIAAIATPPGHGGIGIVRASGPGAEEIASGVFKRLAPGPWESHRLYRGRIICRTGQGADQGLAVLMRAPRSYTGEDVLELHCHGSPVVLQLTLESMLHLGARPAAAGEFTKRAFLNGKLDLTQAEAVMALVGARTPDGATLAADQLFGRLSCHLTALRERLVRVKGHLEVRIDFAEEDLVLGEAGLVDAISDVRDAVASLLHTYARGRLLRHGLRVAITGPPNVGKSSLFNALLGEDRAIVTATAGTTRDVIEESANFSGVPVVLCDTAGLSETAGEVEHIGIDRAQHVARSADIVLIVHDASVRPVAAPALAAHPCEIVVLNKHDLPCTWTLGAMQTVAGGRPVVRVSATEPRGLDELRQAVIAGAGVIPSDGSPTLTTSRQHDALAKVEESLAHAMSGLERGTAPDLVAVDVQAALDHIGAVTGLVSSEDVLDAIFSEFCIGK